MRKEFTMTKEQCEKLLDACKPVPYMVIGGVEPRSPQENVNDAWCELGREMGFDGMTVRPVAGKGIEVFTAEVVGTVVADIFTGHQGDPCIFCNIDHDSVPPGPCIERANLGLDQWRIQPDYIGYIWSHRDYDGPEDRRIGHSPTLEQCKIDIEEWISEHQ